MSNWMRGEQACLDFPDAFLPDMTRQCHRSTICILISDLTIWQLGTIVRRAGTWCTWCYLATWRKWLHFHRAQDRACMQIVTHFVVQSDPKMTWPWRLKMPTQYQMVGVFESYWQVVCSKISFWWLSFYLAHLISSEIMICASAVIARKSDKAV